MSSMVPRFDNILGMFGLFKKIGSFKCDCEQDPTTWATIWMEKKKSFQQPRCRLSWKTFAAAAASLFSQLVSATIGFLNLCSALFYFQAVVCLFWLLTSASKFKAGSFAKLNIGPIWLFRVIEFLAYRNKILILSGALHVFTFRPWLSQLYGR